MSEDTLSPAILNYITNSDYPTDQVSTTPLDSPALNTLLASLQEGQYSTKQEIRSLSASTAPDIDTWISHARTLQDDILRSRETARQIVAEAEEGTKLRAGAVDSAEKERLLGKEVGFNEELTGVLEHVRYANGLLNATREKIVHGDIEAAVGSLEDAEASIAGLEGVARSRVVEVLGKRGRDVREELERAATELWNDSIHVEERRLRISHPTYKPGMASIGLEKLVNVVTGLRTFQSLVLKSSKDIEKHFLKPRMTIDSTGKLAKVTKSEQELACTETSEDTSIATLLNDMRMTIDFLATNLPSSVAIPLSEALVPALSSRLEEQWLEPHVPTTMPETAAFDEVLKDVSLLAERIEKYEWAGSSHLRQWVQQSPKSWLTKRREITLGDVRNLVFDGLQKQEVVERVETRVVSQADPSMATAPGNADPDAVVEDDWDTAWDEPEETSPTSPRKPNAKPTEDDDADASAWGLEDDAEETKNDGGEEDAWGWGNEDAGDAPPSPVAAKRQAPQQQKTASTRASEQEMTLRETFTVTAIPDAVLTIIQQLITDAETLAGPSFTTSPIAPAAPGLYTLPTLALAIYRATAPTAYAKLPVGNMLIYNDASRLADQLRSWQAAKPRASRLRLDSDVAALEAFARRAYSSEMESQRTVIRDLLDGAQGFASSTTPPFKAECEGAVEQTIAQLREVEQMWDGVLSQGALLQSLGSLLATITNKMISEIEDLGDISEADSKQLKALCENVMSLKEVFIQQKPGAEGDEAQQDMTFIYCPAWLKFQYLAEILESSLADIKWMWLEGELSLEFEGEEVVELIEGLFAESDHRRRAVAEIRRGG